jgi:hypothetical protein
VANSDVVIYSGAQVVADFTMHANSHGASDHVSLTVKTGASLHSTGNFDLGYYGGSEVVTINVEQGASISAGGNFLGNRVGPHLINLAGTADGSGASIAYINGATTVDFALTGELLLPGDVVNDVQNYWAGTVLLAQGVGVGDPGWGTTHFILAEYDSNTDVTSITSPGLAYPLGDFTHDYQVTAADYNVMKSNWLTTGHAMNENGEVTGDGFVSLADFALFKDQLYVGALSAQGVPIPEPGTLSLILAALVPAWASVRHRGKSISPAVADRA